MSHVLRRRILFCFDAYLIFRLPAAFFSFLGFLFRAAFQLLPLARAPLQLVANSFVFPRTAGSLFVLPESSSLCGSRFLCFLICFSFSFVIVAVAVASNHVSRTCTAVAKCVELYVARRGEERALS